MHIRLPFSQEIESRLLGALIVIGKPKDARVQETLIAINADYFYLPWAKAIFEIIVDRCTREVPFDLISITSAIPDEIIDLFHTIFSEGYYTDNLLRHDVELIIDYKLWRDQLIVLHQGLVNSLQQIEPHFGLHELSMTTELLKKSVVETKSDVIQTLEQICEEIFNETHETSEFSIDIPGLPKIPHKSLITIAARSGVGKTWLALEFMSKIIDKKPNTQSLFFNLEMNSHVMMERLAKLDGGTGKTRIEVVSSRMMEIFPKNIRLITVPLITIDEIESICRLQALKQPLAVIVVDYIGLVSSKSKHEQRYQQQTDIAKRLAALSMELNCVVIDLIQVNRDFKNKPVGDRCPNVQDASDSMGTVHSSSWWLGVDRPEVDTDDPQYRNLFQIACRKNRYDSGMFKLDLHFADGKFSEFRRSYQTVIEPKNSYLGDF